jgi:hypothetical protein
MFTAFLILAAVMNFASGNIVCGSICLTAAGLRIGFAK